MIPNIIVAAVDGADGQGGWIGGIVFVIVLAAVIYAAGRYKFGWWGPDKKG